MTTILPPDMSTAVPESYIYRSVMMQSVDTTLNSRLYQNEADELCKYFNSTKYECNQDGTLTLQDLKKR